MLFIFRQLRRLELRKRSGQYFVYAIGEIVLIVVGILIALQISEWNQGRNNRAEEVHILSRLKNEFEGNQDRVDEAIRSYDQINEILRSFLDVLGPNPPDVSDEDVHRYVANYDWNPEYIPTQIVLHSLVASDKAGLITNEALRDKLSLWTSSLENLNRIGESMLYQNRTHRSSWLKIYPWREATKMTGRIEDLGPSKYPFDAKAFLSIPELESGVSLAVLLANIYLEDLKKLKALQKEIIDLIDGELAVKE